MHSMVHQSAQELESRLIGMTHVDRSSRQVVDKKNELAFLLTGHRKFYHLKPHSTSWREPVDAARTSETKSCRVECETAFRSRALI